ncbi:MAG: hypothetical protein ACRCST_17490 [Turicibacter sp.]
MERNVSCFIGNSFLTSADGLIKIYFMGAERLSDRDWKIKLSHEKKMISDFNSEPKDDEKIIQLKSNKSEVIQELTFIVKSGDSLRFGNFLGNRLSTDQMGLFYIYQVEKFMPIDEVKFIQIEQDEINIQCNYSELDSSIVAQIMERRGHVC